MPVQGNVLRSRGGYGLGRAVGPIDGNFTAVTTQFSAALNQFNIQYGITSVTYSESNMRAAFAGSPTSLTAILSVPKSTASKNKWVVEFDIVDSGTTDQTAVGICDIANLPASTVRAAATAFGWVISGNAGDKITNNS